MVTLIILQFIPFIFIPALLSLVGSAPYLFLCYPLRCDSYLIKFSSFLKINLFIYLFLAVLGLRCCARAFTGCGEQGLLFVQVHRLLIAVASLVAEHGLQACRLQQLWHVDSVVVARGLSCSSAHGIFLDQGSNPCPLHWQVDSQPLHHQGSPIPSIFKMNHYFM